MNLTSTRLLVLALIAFATYSLQLEEEHNGDCVKECPSGYAAVALNCLQKCPPGFKDQGLYCRLAEYGRGVGYRWKFGDGLKSRGMFKRCERAHGKGNCEKWGAVVYPKCRSGYFAVGCCICRPSSPNCAGLGMLRGLDLSCGKRSLDKCHTWSNIQDKSYAESCFEMI